MSILADFVKSICGLSEQANKIQKIETGVPGVVMFKDGEKLLNFINPVGGERCFLCDELDSLLRLSFDLCESDIAHDVARARSVISEGNAECSPAAAFFVSASHICFTPDINYSRHCVQLNLFSTAQLSRLMDYEDMRRSQADLIRDLRVIFPDAVGSDFLQAVRKIEASQGSSGSTSISHGKERGVMEFQRELIGADKLPEVLPFRVPVWRDLPFMQTVRAAVDVTLPPKPIEFSITPLAGELDTARYMARLELVAELEKRIKEAGKSIPVYNSSL
jgi:hypothetical protein